MSKTKRKPNDEPTPGYPPGTLAWYFAGFPDGVFGVVALLRAACVELAAEDPRLKPLTAFLERWRGFKDPSLVTLDWLCQQVGLRHRDFFALVATQCYDHKNEAVELMKAVVEPAVLARSYDEALKPGGFADRTALLRQAGHHWAPQGNTINVSQQNVNVASEDRGLPDFDATVYDLHRALTEPDTPLQLAPMPIEVTVAGKEKIAHE